MRDQSNHRNESCRRSRCCANLAVLICLAAMWVAGRAVKTTDQRPNDRLGKDVGKNIAQIPTVPDAVRTDRRASDENSDTAKILVVSPSITITIHDFEEWSALNQQAWPLFREGAWEYAPQRAIWQQDRLLRHIERVLPGVDDPAAQIRQAIESLRSL